MGALIRAHDWSTSPLGDPTTWPDVLKSAVATCLATRFPMVVWWGPDLVMLYNDAWQPILGETKHPAGLGRPGKESWPETWEIVGRQFETALQGVASWSEDRLLASDRHGFIQECYFTYSHSPLKDAAGSVVGVLSTVIETTPRVLSERRLRVLRDLSNATIEAAPEGKVVEEACRTLVDILSTDNPDVPFAVQYLRNENGRAFIVASKNIDQGIFPSSLDSEEADAWGIGRVLRERRSVVIDRLPVDSAPLPAGAWPDPTTKLVALPMSVRGVATDLLGVLAVGVNSRLHLDEPYMDFLRLVAAQFADSISALRGIYQEVRFGRVREGLIKDLQGANQALEEQRSAADAIRDAAARVAAIASVHERLYKDQNVSSVKLDRFLGDLCHEIGRTYGWPDGIRTQVKSIAVPTDVAIPLALIVNELVTNVIKHARPPCDVVVEAGSGNSLKIRVSDSGSGSPTENVRYGLGSRIVEALSKQLGARVETKRQSSGYVVELNVPLATPG